MISARVHGLWSMFWPRTNGRDTQNHTEPAPPPPRAESATLTTAGDGGRRRHLSANAPTTLDSCCAVCVKACPSRQYASHQMGEKRHNMYFAFGSLGQHENIRK
ncbi:hypothetical protein M8J77_009429 [Diaphorina citri]|nr:hypothetical protein M8J77_009429 [Diaphorina citri]